MIISKLQYSLTIVDDMITTNNVDINELRRVHSRLTDSIKFLLSKLKSS